MRKNIILTFAIGLLVMTQAFAQQFPAVDRSPLDVAYFPHNLPLQNLRNDYQDPKARVIYSRPAKNGRETFGSNLAPYGQVWRLGANENTELTLYTAANIGGTDVAAGSYSLFAIPGESEWTIIINRKLHNWGAFKHDANDDVLRVSVPVMALENVVENFAMMFSGEGNDAKLMMAWDKVAVELPISFK